MTASIHKSNFPQFPESNFIQEIPKNKEKEEKTNKVACEMYGSMDLPVQIEQLNGFFVQLRETKVIKGKPWMTLAYEYPLPYAKALILNVAKETKSTDAAQDVLRKIITLFEHQLKSDFQKHKPLFDDLKKKCEYSPLSQSGYSSSSRASSKVAVERLNRHAGKSHKPPLRTSKKWQRTVKKKRSRYS